MKIKVIDDYSIKKLFSTSIDKETAINKSIKEIESNNGSIKDIKYLRTNTGYLGTVIIEYQED